MHERRISQLERRLAVLTAKAGDVRFDPAALAADVERTTREMALLEGLRKRNAALDAERAPVEAFKTKIRERKRRIREAVQRTPGRGPSPKDLLKGL